MFFFLQLSFLADQMILHHPSVGNSTLCPCLNYLNLHMAMELFFKINLLAGETNCIGVRRSADGFYADKVTYQFLENQELNPLSYLVVLDIIY